MTHNILIKCIHVALAKNSISDALIRLQLQRFRQLAPTADREATPIPSSLWKIQF